MLRSRALLTPRPSSIVLRSFQITTTKSSSLSSRLIERPPPPPPTFDAVHLRTLSSSSSSSSTTTPPNHENSNEVPLSTLALRILSALAITTLTFPSSSSSSDDHGILRFERCEGPSMHPTISSKGDEIILVESASSWIYGLDGGDSGMGRARVHRLRQEEWEKKVKLEEEEATPTSTNNNNNSDKKEKTTTTTSTSRTRHDHETTWHEPKLDAVNSPPFLLKSYPLTLRHNLDRLLLTGIQIGDVVVVRHPEKAGGTVCKRVLGLPGDMVVRPRDGDTRRMRRRFGANGGEDLVDVLERFGFEGSDDGGRRRRRDDYRNVMDLFQTHDDDDDEDGSNPITSSPSPSLASSSLIVIPDGHIWLEGDNTLNSADSRDYGPVPANLVVGKVVCRIWPLRGEAMNVMRGGRPMPRRGMSFTGSTFLPAGYEGEKIVTRSYRDGGVGGKRKKKEEDDGGGGSSSSAR